MTAGEECTDEKVAFWSQFVDLYYKTAGGAVSCCYSDLCNDGTSAVGLYPTNTLSSGVVSVPGIPPPPFPGLAPPSENLNRAVLSRIVKFD